MSSVSLTHLLLIFGQAKGKEQTARGDKISVRCMEIRKRDGRKLAKYKCDELCGYGLVRACFFFSLKGRMVFIGGRESQCEATRDLVD